MFTYNFPTTFIGGKRECVKHREYDRSSCLFAVVASCFVFVFRFCSGLNSEVNTVLNVHRNHKAY